MAATATALGSLLSIAMRTGCGPRFLNAMPSANASSTGNANTQKTASGSRRNSRTRQSVSSRIAEYFAASLIAQMPPGERDEHVLERRAVRGQLGQDRAALAQQRHERRHGFVRARHGEAGARRGGAHAGPRPEPAERGLLHRHALAQ